MKCLIVGSGSFIGSWLVKLILENSGSSVWEVARSIDRSQSGNFLKYDNYLTELDGATLTRDLDVVYYLASADHKACASNPRDALEIGILGFRDLLKALGKSGFKGRVVFVSTCQVYGALFDEQSVDETSPVACATTYAMNHALCEKLLEQWVGEAEGRSGLVARVSNSFGVPIFDTPGGRAPVINEFALELIEKQTITILSDGSPIRNFIPVDLLVSRIHQDATQISVDVPFEIINYVSDWTCSISQLALFMGSRSEIIGLQPTVWVNNRAYKEFDANAVCLPSIFESSHGKVECFNNIGFFIDQVITEINLVCKR